MVGSVAELLPRADEVGVTDVVELGDALPAGCAEDPAQRFAVFDDVDPRTGSTVRCGGGAVVGDGLAGPDPVDVPGGHVPRVERP
mgnify:FL=1